MLFMLRNPISSHCILSKLCLGPEKIGLSSFQPIRWRKTQSKWPDMNGAYPTSQRKLAHCLSPGRSYLLANTMSDSLRLRKLHIWSSRKALWNETYTGPYFLTIKASQRKKRRAQTLVSYPHEYLAGFFFHPLVDSLSDSYKNPSFTHVFYWIDWRYLFHSLTLRNKLKYSTVGKCK